MIRERPVSYIVKIRATKPCQLSGFRGNPRYIVNNNCILNCKKNFFKFRYLCRNYLKKITKLPHWNKIRHVYVFFIPQLDNHEIKPGKSLKVNISVPNLRLFVGNIPKSKGKEEILEEFGKLTGKVNSRRVTYLYLLPTCLTCIV